MRDVEPVREDDEAEPLFFDVAGDLFDLRCVVLFLGVDDQPSSCFFFFFFFFLVGGECEMESTSGEKRERERRSERGELFLYNFSSTPPSQKKNLVSP